ncbi:circadian clock KaiB family protein [Pantanalinema sp. GBBB05]|uniref:circadian clock KaiB family protein n=1 Tax=Pantanalinema sp. GBBB05 TaxID=2604139 RepID=UPI001D69819A|nr:thiol-disulfide isomerase [Pantanalinema sp. GBBB05]
MQTNHSPEPQNDWEQTYDSIEPEAKIDPGLKPEFYQLRLYVAGNDPKSVRALQTVIALCEENLPGCYDLEVIDIYQQPERLETDQVFATPTLLKERPLPHYRLIGDLSDTEKLRSCLGI